MSIREKRESPLGSATADVDRAAAVPDKGRRKQHDGSGLQKFSNKFAEQLLQEDEEEYQHFRDSIYNFNRKGKSKAVA